MGVSRLVSCVLLTVGYLLPVTASTGHDWTANKNLNSFSLFPRDLPVGTCNAQTPCVNGACCGTDGLCGYSPTQCASGNCTSNCDAKAECGQYGAPGKQNCPLNVCCSKFGFCGSTDDFCGTGCQSGFGGCGPPNRPSCGTGSGSVTKRSIGYYESWSSTRKCQAVMPEDLNLAGYTHINFAFAFFDPSSFAIAPMDGTSGQLYNRFTNLKTKNRGLQTWISVGGWSFTDPGPTRNAFSTMTSSQGNRASFISQLMHFMDTYGFDGVDLDWEYPQADDRGGVAADAANYVSLVSEMRAAFGRQYGISMTLPTSFWYLQHFDLKGIQPNVDWFNLMAYDLHGTWDAESKYVGPYLATHTNITEIDLGLDLLWRAGVDSSKVVLGEAYYGRSFTLKDPSCNTPNGVCQFSGGANAGPCSNAAGILDNQEIQNIIAQNNLQPTLDTTAAVKWITWNSNQWVSYDDADTFKLKRNFANNRCLGGLMVWAMDQVDQTGGSSGASFAGVTDSQRADADQKSQDLAAGVTCRTTDCDQKCPRGTNQVAQVGGQPGQLSTSSLCPKGKYRNVCCDDGTITGICTWRGYRGAGLSCVKGCQDGETEVLTDTKYHDKHGDTTCSGGLQSYCCKGFKGAPSKKQLEKEAADAAKAAAEAAAEQAALDIAAKAFCRIAVPALLAPLELLEDLIPIVGEILDIAEIAATPALINLCVKQVEKEGSAELKIFGKKHTISGFTKPTGKPTSRPPESSHTKPSTSDDCPATANAKRADGDPACRKRKREVTRTITTKVIGTTYARAPGTFTCRYAEHGQACLAYSSMIHHGGVPARVTCRYKQVDKTERPAVASYNKQRNAAWSMRIPAANRPCERDEWPPAAFINVNDGVAYIEGGKQYDIPETQYIRLDPSADNTGAGKLWLGICPKVAENSNNARDSNPRPSSSTDDRAQPNTVYTMLTATYTRSVFDIAFDMAGYQDDGDDGLHINPCQPDLGDGKDYRGYALVDGDPFFKIGSNNKYDFRAQWAGSPPSKRDLNPALIGVLEGNTTRRITDEELLRDFGLQRCQDETCSEEQGLLGSDAVLVDFAPSQLNAPRSSTVSVAEITSAARAYNTAEAVLSGGPERSRVPIVQLPRETGS